MVSVKTRYLLAGAPEYVVDGQRLLGRSDEPDHASSLRREVFGAHCSQRRLTRAGAALQYKWHRFVARQIRFKLMYNICLSVKTF